MHSILNKTQSVLPTAKDLASTSTVRYFERNGAPYVHWGGNHCPDTADPLYYGNVVTSHYSHGGRSSYLCLIDTPKFLNTVAGYQNQRTRVYGTEFGINNVPDATYFGNSDDIPCAMCAARRKDHVMMIPGTTECPQYWTLEYNGYLMAEYYVDIRSTRETICVDKNPAKVPRTSAKLTAGQLYFVESTCTGIKCAPYTEGYELTCAVCSK